MKKFMKVLIFLSVLASVPNVPCSAADSRLFKDITAERELFVRFRFGENERDILCAVNRDMGKDSVGLLLLEPSGFLKSLVIDRGTLTIVHKKLSIPRKDLRGEFTRRGVPVSLARRIAGVKGGKSK
jgi:hypothetical protein